MSSHHNIFKISFNVLGAIIILLVAFSFLFFFKERLKQLESSIIASVFPTFFMAIGLISANLLQYLPLFARSLWMFAVIGHLLYVFSFTKKFAFNNEEQVIPSWFIVYVGFVACANVSNAFGYTNFGRMLVIIGVIGFSLILLLNLIRIRKKHILPEPIKPLNAIFTAPLNLCIVGYMALFNPSSDLFLIALLIVSLSIFTFTIIMVFKNNFKKFYPSYCAYTFPFVITVTAYKLAINRFSLPFNGVIVLLEVICTIVVILVTVNYVKMIKKMM